MGSCPLHETMRRTPLSAIAPTSAVSVASLPGPWAESDSWACMAFGQLFMGSATALGHDEEEADVLVGAELPGRMAVRAV